MKSSYILAIVGVIVAVAVYIIYRRRRPLKRCGVGVAGSTCEKNSDCHFPNGKCFQGADGLCNCICATGYGGANCQTQTGVWVTNKKVATQNCYPTSGNNLISACNVEFGHYLNQTGPNGQPSSVTTINTPCSGVGCQCANNQMERQWQCEITSWVDPTTNFAQCATTERPCSGYKCVTSS